MSKFIVEVGDTKTDVQGLDTSIADAVNATAAMINHTFSMINKIEHISDEDRDEIGQSVLDALSGSLKEAGEK